MDDANIGTDRRNSGDPLPGERAGDPGDPSPLGQAGSLVAADEPEREVGGAGGVAGCHPGVRVFLELERRGPALLHGVAQPVQGADAGVAAPGEDQLPGAPHPDQLVVDHVGRHSHKGQVAALLADQLVARRMRDQVREPLERDDVVVSDELANRLRERNDLRHARLRLASRRGRGERR
jgi:hypothetical protein